MHAAALPCTAGVQMQSVSLCAQQHTRRVTLDGVSTLLTSGSGTSNMTCLSTPNAKLLSCRSRSPQLWPAMASCWICRSRPKDCSHSLARSS